MLVTYIVDSLESVGDAVRATTAGDELKVDGLVARKHVRTSFPVESLGRGVLSYNTDPSAEWQLFPVPAHGPRLEYIGEFPGELEKLGVEAGVSEYEIEHLMAGHPQFSVAGSPFAAKITWANGTAKFETWQAEKTHSELVADAEVGILTVDEDETEMGDVVAKGRVRKVPEDKQSSPIMFHQINAWRPYGRASSSLGSGMHPKLNLNVEQEAPKDKCLLYVRLDLPPSVFVDQFELETLPDMTPSSELVGVWGSTDLEAPVWMVDAGSTALVRLEGPGSYEIPLHLRYEVPGYDQEREVPAPQVFWACQDTVAQPPIGVEEFFPVGTSFYSMATQSHSILVPSADPTTQTSVEVVTGLSVVVCTLFVLWALWKKSLKV